MACLSSFGDECLNAKVSSKVFLCEPPPKPIHERSLIQSLQSPRFISHESHSLRKKYAQGIFFPPGKRNQRTWQTFATFEI